MLRPKRAGMAGQCELGRTPRAVEVGAKDSHLVDLQQQQLFPTGKYPSSTVLPTGDPRPTSERTVTSPKA